MLLVNRSVRLYGRSTMSVVDWSVRPSCVTVGQSRAPRHALADSVGCELLAAVSSCAAWRMFVTSPPPYLLARPRALS